MSKGSGGGFDTAGISKATKEATALQKMIYEQSREDVQPWYQAGKGSINKLSDLLGINGGSIQNRDQIYNELLPQYTQENQGQVIPNQYIDNETGELVSIGNDNTFFRGKGAGILSTVDGENAYQIDGRQFDKQGALAEYGYSPYSTSPDPTTDFTGLNSAVDARLSGQTTPDNYGSLLENFDLNKFEADPSYQYRQDESQKALERMMSAQGITLGGAGYGEINPQVAKALDEQSQNIASNEYGAAYGRYNADQQNIYNRLMGVAGMGQGSTGQLQQAGQSYATNVGQLTTGLASAQANAAAAKASQPSMFSQILKTGSQLAPLFMSDVRLKENIKLVDVENGHNIYEFDYLDRSGRYRGVMAHEVQKIDPDAVQEMANGYLAVDYGKIGIKMEAV